MPYFRVTTTHSMLPISPPAMPLNNPHIATVIGTSLCVASVGCSSYLFLQRVCAIYADSPRVRFFFSTFWSSYHLSNIGTVIVSTRPTFIPGTHHFQDAGVNRILASSVLAAITFDSCVFIAISYKVMSTHALVDGRVQWSSLVSGKALTPLSRAVLQSGQQYYL